MNYFRRWDCEVCNDHQESVDTPKVKVCDRCSGEARARQDMQMYEFERQLRKAYERGYKHGRRQAVVECPVCGLRDGSHQPECQFA